MAVPEGKSRAASAPTVASLRPASTAGAPLCAQLFTQLRDQILSGVLAYNAALPSARAMASSLGVSRNTVETALRQLVDAGLIARRTGAGTVVSYVRPADASRHPGAATNGPRHSSAVTACFARRQLLFAHLRRTDTHVLKVYTLGIGELQPTSESVMAAERIASAYLAAPHGAMRIAGIDWWHLPSHGVGALVVHRGRDAIFAVLDVWVDSSMLRHHVWVASLDADETFLSLASTDMAVCVWELAVMQHERSAWLRHVLREDGRPDLDGYLADVLTGDV
jgi:DNA-binding transcriptional regulator YhcF (GntR family)